MLGKDLKKAISDITETSLKEVRGWVRRWCRMEEILEDMLRVQRDHLATRTGGIANDELQSKVNTRNMQRESDLTEHGRK